VVRTSQECQKDEKERDQAALCLGYSPTVKRVMERVSTNSETGERENNTHQ